jgi:beta-glucanase (GH16 family)
MDARTVRLALPAFDCVYPPAEADFVKSGRILRVRNSGFNLRGNAMAWRSADSGRSLQVRHYSQSAAVCVAAVLTAAGWGGQALASPAQDAASGQSEPDTARPVVATPVFSPAQGTFTRPQSVRITDVTHGAKIYYALHGAYPNSNSTPYTGPIKVSSTEKIRAIAIKKGDTNSVIATATYTIKLPLTAAPVFTPPSGIYPAPRKVSITDATGGAAIYYTINGGIPTTSSSKYTAPILVSGKETIKAIAEAPNRKPSAVASASYTIALIAAAPIFHPGGGSYSKAQSVTISDSTPGATIYYTIDDSTPSASSTKYTGPISVPVSPSVQTLKAIAIATGYKQSPIASASYPITPLVATPTFFPSAGTYSNTTYVALSDTTKNAVIHYTTDGTMPTVASAKFTEPVEVAATETLQAIAVAGGNVSAIGSSTYTITDGVSAPATISTTPAQNGAVLVSLHSNTAGATVYYTEDGSAPTTASTVYLAPFLVASSLTVKTLAVASSNANSPVTEKTFDLNIPSGTLVWSDEFANSTEANAQPNPKVWTYDSGNSGFGNNELEDYCAWGSNASPCSTAEPNAYVGTDGFLHIVARQPSTGVYTSARLKTQGLFSFRYGRMEVRAMVPEAQGFWPAAWLLGNNIATINWPGCGEQDNLERVNAATAPDWNGGSIHGPGFTGGNLGSRYNFPAGQTAAEWHTYGMIWSEGKVEYYIDDPTKPYGSFTPSSLSSLTGAVWPFDEGQSNFIILNLAIGGSYPGPPDSTTPFPSEFVVDYVRIYTN